MIQKRELLSERCDIPYRAFDPKIVEYFRLLPNLHKKDLKYQLHIVHNHLEGLQLQCYHPSIPYNLKIQPRDQKKR